MELSHEAAQHPECCVSLSRSLLNSINSVLPSPKSFVLSIGSGSGLLEKLLHDHAPAPKLTIRGVEVISPATDPNKFLPEEQTYHVKGTWDLCTAAAEAPTWMFVYPRDTKLLERYIDVYGTRQSEVKVIIWLGPMADWTDYEQPLAKWSNGNVVKYVGSECGVASYEMMAVAKKRDHDDEKA